MTGVDFIADKISVRSHMAGDNNRVSLDVGHYEIEKLARLLLIPEQTEIKVRVEW